MKTGLLLALATALLWGIAPVMEKIGLSVDASPFTLIVFRSLVVAFVATLAIPFSSFVTEIPSVPLKSLILIGGSGIIAGLIAMGAYYWALKLSPASVVVPLASTYPLFTLIYSFMLLKEKPTPLQVAGVLFIVAGIVLISAGERVLPLDVEG